MFEEFSVELKFFSTSEIFDKPKSVNLFLMLQVITIYKKKVYSIYHIQQSILFEYICVILSRGTKAFIYLFLFFE